MKGENEFVYFLAAGLIILAVMLAIFGLSVQTGTDCPAQKCPTKVRFGVVEAVKTFSIPEVKASNLLQKTATDNVDKTIFNGLLFGEDKIRYDLSKSNLQDVSVSFNVKETNNYGRLIIRVNDKTIEAKAFDPGDYTIKIPAEILSDHMIIEIAAESSAWRIWAPTVYVLEDVIIDFTSYFSESSQYKFYLGEEYQGLRFSKADIILSENVGTLIVDVNGRNIWSSPVNNQQSIILEKSDLRLGDNIISFRAAKDSKFAGRGTIAVIFDTQFPETINQTGIVTAAQTLSGVSTQFYA